MDPSKPTETAVIQPATIIGQKWMDISSTAWEQRQEFVTFVWLCLYLLVVILYSSTNISGYHKILDVWPSGSPVCI